MVDCIVLLPLLLTGISGTSCGWTKGNVLNVLNLLKLLTNKWGIIWPIVNETLKLFDWCDAQISVGLVSPF